MNGVIVVDKEKGKTSFDEIRKIRKEYNIKKVGHTGTLDPMATGVLPILVGEATKLSDYLMNHDKEYIATLTLGEKRSTGDTEGEVVLKEKVPTLNKEKVEEVLNQFLGEINQVPPIYSAIKINGKKLYEYARKGEKVEIKSRKVIIFDIKLLELKENNITFKVHCSKGTYIRSLCEDIAKSLDTVGYMSSLRRTRVGNFTLDDVGRIIELEEILKREQEYYLKENELSKLTNGVKILTNLKDGLVRVYENNKFIGVGEVQDKKLKRKIVLNLNKIN